MFKFLYCCHISQHTFVNKPYSTFMSAVYSIVSD